jgi:membrane fusion protein (multidrug efflux system)
VCLLPSKGIEIVKLKPIVTVVLKRVLPTLVGLVFLVLVIVALAGFFREKRLPGQIPVPVRRLGPNDRTDRVHEVVKDYIEEAVGTLKAASRTQISAQVLARITRITVSAGDTVAEGDVLVELDAEKLEAALKQAKASLAQAVAGLEQAQDEYNRANQLRSRPSPVISEGEFKARVSDLEAAKAKRDQAEQAVAEAKVLLSYTTIKAPKAGMIVDRLAEPGDLARPGEPLLVLYDPTSLRLEVPVMENLAEVVHVGDKLTVVIDALGGKKFTGTVDEKVPQVQAASRSFLVKVSMPPSEELVEGNYGRLEIPTGKRRHLCLATAAIETVGQLEFVEVVHDDGTLERRFIKTGRLGMPGRVEVLSGLKAGERVLLRPSVGEASSPSPEKTGKMPVLPPEASGGTPTNTEAESGR